MPRYEVFTTDPIDPDIKQQLATEITEIHCAVTGAPPSFVRVVFVAVGKDNCFVAGERRHDASIRGTIREGRSHESVAELLHGLSSAFHRAVGIPEEQILISLGARPGWQIMEGGRVLPEAGDEDDWLEAGKQEKAEA